jgi:translation initiation factor IF-2
MANGKPIRLSKAAREFNVGKSTIVEFLSKKGFDISPSPNTKLTPEEFQVVEQEFQTQKAVKEEASKVGLEYRDHQTVTIDNQPAAPAKEDVDVVDDSVFIKDTSLGRAETKEVPKEVPKKKAIEKKPEVAKETPIKEEKQVEKQPEVSVEKEKPTKEEKAAKEPVAEKVEKPKEEKTEKKKEEKVAEPKEIIVAEPITGEKVVEEKVEEKVEEQEQEAGKPKVLGKIDLGKINEKTRPTKKSAAEKKKEREAKKEAAKTGKTKKTETAKEEEKIEDAVAEVVSEKEKQVENDSKAKAETEEKPKEVKDDRFIKTKVEKLTGPKILDKIELPEEKKKTKKPVASSRDASSSSRRRRRKRIKSTNADAKVKTTQTQTQTGGKTDRPGRTKAKDNKRSRKDRFRPEVSEEDVQKQIKETLAKLTGGGKSKSVKHRRDKRQSISAQKQEDLIKEEEGKQTIQVTEFVTANELASLMDVAVNDIIATCMSLGMFVSINQRLDAETLALVADEFGFGVEFVSVELQEAIMESEIEDKEEDLLPRIPIVTVMGHVDHGKTKLLDFIREANVVAGEAGGITQHIGAYEVELKNGKKITFLDTPGHEAFTAMRARGASVTDIAIIIIAADDNVMPQTKEAINHAQAAGVPMVFAINKIDKPHANPDKIKEELSQMNILVEDWGGKYQSQEISAKQGTNIEDLLEKVLLEAEMLDLKANPNKLASGTVIESSLDKGRGYVTKLLVQNGTMHVSDVVIAGAISGKVKAMYNERNQVVKEAGPSTPVLLLGLNGAPQAGDGFNVMRDEKEAKEIANKRQQLQREQGLRTQKHLTLDEIGRRIAIGDFKELNLIVKADVDGSVEALSDSLLKLSNEEIQVNVIHKSVGQISESDVLLASASDAIIIGFQIRPSLQARKLAEKEQIDIRLYSIIYQAIEEVKDSMEGMLSPDVEEKIVCNVEIREVFKITKVGTVAGCMVLDGTITRNTKIRVIRDGIVTYTGTLGSLKRFKDDVKEVKSGYECGLNIENFNDIKVGDIIEGYEQTEVKRKLK